MLILRGNTWERYSHCWKADGTHRNGVPTVKCLRTHYGRHGEPFSSLNSLNCRIFHIQYQNFSWGDTLGPPQIRPRCLDPNTNFRLAHQHSHCSCFTKWPLLSTELQNYRTKADRTRCKQQVQPLTVQTMQIAIFSTKHCSKLGMYQIFASYSLQYRIVVRIVYSYLDK